MKNWKTTLAGLLILAATVVPNVRKPSDLATQDTLTKIIGGIGLIFAADSKKEDN